MLAALIILWGARNRIPDFITLGVSSVIVGLALRWSPGTIALTIVRTVFSGETLELAACVGLIRILGSVLQRYGTLETMASSLKRLLKSSRYTIMAVPALLGSLSAFGGAIISAPLVDTAGDRLGFSPTRKAAVNMVFRHSVFFLYPFSTTILFTATIARVSPVEIVGQLWPLGIIMFVTSYLRLVKNSHEAVDPTPTTYSTALKEFLVSSGPLSVPVVLTCALGVNLTIALAAGVIMAMAISRKSEGFSLNVIWKSVDYPSIATVLGVMVFKAFVVQMDFLPVAMDSLSRRGVPLEVLAGVGIFLFAFVSGAIQTGIAVALPMLLAAAPTYEHILLYASFTYMIGFSAYLMSPLHLCQVLTNRYFKVDLAPVLREYWPVPVVTFLSGIALHLIHRAAL